MALFFLIQITKDNAMDNSIINLPNFPDFTDNNYLIFKDYLKTINQILHETLFTLEQQGPNVIQNILIARTHIIDKILNTLFEHFFTDINHDIALFAVGGYGRSELFPHSDVDILIFGKATKKHSKAIAQFHTALWDIGITPALSVRTYDQTLDAITDHTIATALLESRFIAGDEILKDNPITIVKKSWTVSDFYHVKMMEIQKRHQAHHATEYNLQPHIKNTVGGLRDLHVLGWLGKLYFDDVDDLSDLVKNNFINQNQLDNLKKAKHYLWCIRHHLHALTGRYEDRLTFGEQKHIAPLMGFFGDGNTPAEQLMKQYYRHAMTIASLSELLCNYFYESFILFEFDCKKIDDDFSQIWINNSPNIPISTTAIDINYPDVFTQKPENLLKIFLVMGQKNTAKLTAKALQALYQAKDLIDDDYRKNPIHQQLFLANLQENNALFERLRLMKRYGVLSNYLPLFEPIIGLMQYDLFHRYTVDEHTLLLVYILQTLNHLNDTQKQAFDLVGEIYQHIHRKDILTISAIFHDIAKGRGGDHSELGAKDVYEFCLGHHMSEHDADFAAWLVREHLTMSLTAQKQDIYDPEVIKKFAKLVGSVTRLNHLYVLTVADMNATNSQLWNSWRAALLKRLYLSAHQVLTLGEAIIDKHRLLQSRQKKAKALLEFSDDAIDNLWEYFGEAYFLSQKHTDIAWQTHEILTHQNNLPFVSLQEHSDLALDAMQLFVCIPDRKNLFAKMVSILDSLGLSVLNANILTVNIDGTPCALDTYVVIDRFALRDNTGRFISKFLTDIDAQNTLKSELIFNLDKKSIKPSSEFGLERSLKHFSVTTDIRFERASMSIHQNHHKMSLVTKDSTGLLAKIGWVFSRLNIQVHGAKITTMGERAEDIFFISDNGCLLSDEKLINLKNTLLNEL